MKTGTTAIVTLSLAGALAFCAYESRQVAALNAQLVAQHKRAESAARQAADWRAQQASADHELALAQQELAARVEADATTAARLGTHASEIRMWIAQVKQLRQLFAQRPDQWIPELKVLTDLDWLSVVRDIRGLDDASDIRESLAHIRDRAKAKFLAQLLSPALRKFAAASDGMLPTDLSQLLPYLNSAIDPGLLQRYELRQSGKVAEASSRGHAIVERAAVDADYDSRYTMDARGNFGSSTPFGSAALGDDVASAQQRFAAANNGRQPKDSSDILPFIESPIARGMMEATADFQKAHNGRMSNEPADLLPYAKDPAVRAEIERMIAFRTRQSR